MKFLLLDRIVELESRRRIVASKALSLSEEYLADHFPRFPVLPGVFMLEAMVQASAWLVHVSEDFSHGLVCLKEARNVTFKSFVTPGRVLTIESECKELAEERSVFSARVHVEEREMVKANLVLSHINLADRNPALSATDERLRAEHRSRYGLLRGAAALAS